MANVRGRRERSTAITGVSEPLQSVNHRAAAHGTRPVVPRHGVVGPNAVCRVVTVSRLSSGRVRVYKRAVKARRCKMSIEVVVAGR